MNLSSAQGKDGLAQNVKKEIQELAKKYQIEKVILFGSRARGDYQERSDIDLAVSGGNIMGFRLAVDDDVRTLLMFDVLNLDAPVQPSLLDSIEREGILIYEKV